MRRLRLPEDLEDDASFNALARLVPEDEAASPPSPPEETGVEEAPSAPPDPRLEAERFLQETRRRAEEIESQAYNQGFAQGRKDGEELGRRQYEARAQRLQEIIRSLEDQVRRMLAKHEAQVIRLATAVARALVRTEIRTNPDVLRVAVQAAMERVVEGSRVRLHLHPRDAEIVAEHYASGAAAPGRSSVEIIPDPQVRRSGCLIETDFGLVDATVETRWQALSEAVEELLRERTRLPAADLPLGPPEDPAPEPGPAGTAPPGPDNGGDPA
ncbi:hypothetical protein HCU62_08140 [Dissulfurirhabdus thermomarina]|nr:hypothetical protein [Dissulfurirhabdus thermomarina]